MSEQNVLHSAMVTNGGVIWADTFIELVYRTACVGTLLVFALSPIYFMYIDLLKAVVKTALADVMGHAVYDEQRFVFSLILPLVHTIFYVLFNSIFFTFDLLKLCQQYKLNRKKHQIPTRALLLRTLVEAFISQIILTPVLAYYVQPVFVHYGMLDLASPLPAPKAIATALVIAHLFNDFAFYFTHRILHHKAIYQYVHKQHHEYSGTVSISSEYAHGIEALFSNILPTLGGVMLFPTHPLVVLVWLLMRMWQTYEVHSGFCFRGSLWDKLGLSHARGTAHHDFHHTVNVGNFGEGEYLDYVFGSMRPYMELGLMDGYINKLSRDAGKD